MSWRRTFVAVCALGALGVRHGVSAVGPGVLLVGVVAGAVAVLLGRSIHRSQQSAELRDGRVPAGLAALVVVAGLITLVSAL